MQKKYILFPIDENNFQILKKNRIEFFSKEALKTEHFLNVFGPRIWSERFPKRQNSNLTKLMNVWR